MTGPEGEHIGGTVSSFMSLHTVQVLCGLVAQASDAVADSYDPPLMLSAADPALELLSP